MRRHSGRDLARPEGAGQPAGLFFSGRSPVSLSSCRPRPVGAAMGWAAEGPGPAWGSLGLAAVILSSCFLLTQARRIDVTMDPPEPREGQDVTMTPGGTIDIFSVNWFRGTDTPHNRIFVYLPATGQENGPRFTGREKGRTDGSLTIRGLMLNDTGRFRSTSTSKSRSKSRSSSRSRSTSRFRF
ncbi:cell adhesion molecule CEACAM16-like [Paroedura picta]|uniref:cell adhesion molecule CEACAM16-like n=1 Tax=Paroedura picta TaxID=143630 RepID=UPI00405627C5